MRNLLNGRTTQAQGNSSYMETVSLSVLEVSNLFSGYWEIDVVVCHF